MSPDEYLKQGVDGRREADYTEAYNVDKNTDEVEPKLDVLHADSLDLGKKLDNVISRLDVLASKLDTANANLNTINTSINTVNTSVNTVNTSVRSVATKLDSTNSYLSQIEDNTSKDNNGNN